MEPSEEEVNDLIAILLRAYRTLDDGDFLLYLDIQKIFYHLRRRLDGESDVAEEFPFYWYLDGPVSKSVKRAVDRAVERDILEVSRTRGKAGEKYRPVTDGGVAAQPSTSGTDEQGSADLELAFEAVDVVLEEDYDIYDTYDEKIADVYRDAPYDFQRYYKLELQPEVELFVEDRLLAPTADGLLELISKGEAFLPFDPAFEEFDELYSWYVTLSRRYLEALDSDNKRGIGSFEKLTESMWETFCSRLRLVAHDEEYDDEVDSWYEDYEQQRDRFADELATFEAFVEEKLRADCESAGRRSPEESPWGAVASAYLDGEESLESTPSTDRERD